MSTSKSIPEGRNVSPLSGAYDFWNKNRTPKSMGDLLHAAAPTISKAITSYAGGDKSMRGRARVLATGAFKSYDPNRGTKLESHLLTQLQPLRRTYFDRASPLRIPERVRIDRVTLEGGEQELRDNLGRDPSDDEVADHIGLSRKRISHIRAFGRAAVPTSSFLSGDEDQAELPGVSRVDPVAVWTDYVYHDLDALDKQIFDWRTGAHGKRMLSNNEIARRLKLSAGAVSQRAAKIMAKIQEGVSGA